MHVIHNADESRRIDNRPCTARARRMDQQPKSHPRRRRRHNRLNEKKRVAGTERHVEL